MLGLGKVKPAWLAEIGTQTAESFDGENWFRLPSLSRAKVTIKMNMEINKIEETPMRTVMLV